MAIGAEEAPEWADAEAQIQACVPPLWPKAYLRDFAAARRRTAKGYLGTPRALYYHADG